MSIYRKEWDCCGSATETNAWEPEACPFCSSLAAPTVAAPEPMHKDVEWLVDAAEMARTNPEVAIKIRANCQAGADAVAQPQLTVWYGSLPESNGKSNFTAILMRKEGKHFDNMMDGITIDKSEYPDRVRYEADRVRYLIGERAERPDILDYDADKHSGYTAPADAGTVAADQALDADRYRAWRGAVIDANNAFIDAMIDAMPVGDEFPSAAQWDAAIDKARAAQSGAPATDTPGDQP